MTADIIDPILSRTAQDVEALQATPMKALRALCSLNGIDVRGCSSKAQVVTRLVERKAELGQVSEKWPMRALRKECEARGLNPTGIVSKCEILKLLNITPLRTQLQELAHQEDTTATPTRQNSLDQDTPTRSSPTTSPRPPIEVAEAAAPIFSMADSDEEDSGHDIDIPVDLASAIAAAVREPANLEDPDVGNVGHEELAGPPPRVNQFAFQSEDDKEDVGKDLHHEAALDMELERSELFQPEEHEVAASNDPDLLFPSAAEEGASKLNLPELGEDAARSSSDLNSGIVDPDRDDGNSSEIDFTRLTPGELAAYCLAWSVDLEDCLDRDDVINALAKHAATQLGPTDDLRAAVHASPLPERREVGPAASLLNEGKTMEGPSTKLTRADGGVPAGAVAGVHGGTIEAAAAPAPLLVEEEMKESEGMAAMGASSRREDKPERKGTQEKDVSRLQGGSFSASQGATAQTPSPPPAGPEVSPVEAARPKPPEVLRTETASISLPGSVSTLPSDALAAETSSLQEPLVPTAPAPALETEPKTAAGIPSTSTTARAQAATTSTADTTMPAGTLPAATTPSVGSSTQALYEERNASGSPRANALPEPSIVARTVNTGARASVDSLDQGGKTMDSAGAERGKVPSNSDTVKAASDTVNYAAIESSKATAAPVSGGRRRNHFSAFAMFRSAKAEKTENPSNVDTKHTGKDAGESNDTTRQSQQATANTDRPVGKASAKTGVGNDKPLDAQASAHASSTTVDIADKVAGNNFVKATDACQPSSHVRPGTASTTTSATSGTPARTTMAGARAAAHPELDEPAGEAAAQTEADAQTRRQTQTEAQVPPQDTAAEAQRKEAAAEAAGRTDSGFLDFDELERLEQLKADASPKQTAPAPSSAKVPAAATTANAAKSPFAPVSRPLEHSSPSPPPAAGSSAGFSGEASVGTSARKLTSKGRWQEHFAKQGPDFSAPSPSSSSTAPPPAAASGGKEAASPEVPTLAKLMLMTTRELKTLARSSDLNIDGLYRKADILEFLKRIWKLEEPAGGTSAGPPSPPPTSGETEAKLQEDPAEALKKSSVKQLLALAASRKIDVTGCVEKAEIVERLLRPPVPQSTTAYPASSSSSSSTAGKARPAQSQANPAKANLAGASGNQGGTSSSFSSNRGTPLTSNVRSAGSDPSKLGGGWMPASMASSKPETKAPYASGHTQMPEMKAPPSWNSASAASPAASATDSGKGNMTGNGYSSSSTASPFGTSASGAKGGNASNFFGNGGFNGSGFGSNSNTNTASSGHRQANNSNNTASSYSKSPSGSMSWSTRIQMYFDRYPGFSATVPPEAELWTASELEIYFGSNGEIWPRGKRPAWNSSGSKPRGTRGEGLKYSSEAHHQSRSAARLTPELKQHFATLGLAETTPHDVIRRHYRRLARECHPDKHLNDREGATERFQDLNAAYEAIKNHLRL